MKTKADLQRIINITELNKLFKSFSITSGFDVSLYDIDGKECFSVRKNDCICNFVNRKAFCEKMISYSGKKSYDLKEPYIFETACGLIMCITALTYESEILGFISCGPIILWDKDDYFKENLIKTCKNMEIEFSDNMYETIKKIDCSVMTGWAKMLGILVNHLIIESQKFIENKTAYEKLRVEHIKAKREFDIYQRNNNFKKYPIEREKELLAYVQLGEKDKAREIINIFLNEIFSYACGDLEIIRAKLYEFTAFLSRTAVEAGAPIEDLKGIIKQSSRIFIDKIDFSDLCFTTTTIMEEYIDVVSKSKKNTSIHLSKAIEYINSHYKEKITLNSMAESIYVSSYYLSHLFRSGINMTFSDYLNKVRTEKAKIFLMEGKSVERVCEEVGYGDVGYFNKIFKKYFGVSPAKYRKAYLSEKI